MPEKARRRVWKFETPEVLYMNRKAKEELLQMSMQTELSSTPDEHEHKPRHRHKQKSMGVLYQVELPWIEYAFALRSS